MTEKHCRDCPGCGHLGAGVHSEGPQTARYSPRDDVVYPVDGPGKLITVALASPYLPGRLVSDRAKRGKYLARWYGRLPSLAFPKGGTMCNFFFLFLRVVRQTDSFNRTLPGYPHDLAYWAAMGPTPNNSTSANDPNPETHDMCFSLT